MMDLNRNNYVTYTRPIKVIQFGAGNFLRAFCDMMVQQANQSCNFNGNIAVVEYITAELANQINKQDGLYQLVLQGLVNNIPVRETRVVDSISAAINPKVDYMRFMDLAREPEVRYIISNTTEAGIIFDDSDDDLLNPAKSFPAKLTQLLFARYQFTKGNVNKGFIILPCELIEDNGVVLKKICLKYAELWKLETKFIHWLEVANYFCSTLVDRIVTGFPVNDNKLLVSLPYEDKLVVVAEPYHSWVISGAEHIQDELIFNQSIFNVKLVTDLAPYRQLKVRLLNAVHTAIVPVAYLLGFNEVRLATEDKLVSQFITKLVDDEIIPTLAVTETEARIFANEVMQRFANPYIVHLLISIALNSISKFVARDLPIIKDYQQKFNKIPNALSFSMASLLVFYSGKRSNEIIMLNDDSVILDFCKQVWGYSDATISQKVQQLLQNFVLWGEDLSLNTQLKIEVSKWVDIIINKGITSAVEELLK